MSGSDALHVRLTLGNLSELPGECARLLKVSLQKKYKDNFGWIDHVRLLRDAKLKEQLFAQLHSECLSGARDVNYVVPHVREPHRLANLRGEWDKDAESVLDSDAVRARLVKRAAKGDASTFVNGIKSDRIGEPSLETETWTISWPLLEGLVWATEHRGCRFVLSAGDWFELDADFVASVEKRFDKITSQGLNLKFPPAIVRKIPKKSYFEKEYNVSAASAMQLCNLDRTSMTKRVASTVEPCDLLHVKRGIFVHVKDGRKSAVLSHLFEQGVVSLDIFLSVAEARKQVRTLAGVGKSGSVLCEPIVPSKLTVVFAIVDRARPPGEPWRLPFFSMLAAQHAADRIADRQASVRIVRVDDQRP